MDVYGSSRPCPYGLVTTGPASSASGFLPNLTDNYKAFQTHSKMGDSSIRLSPSQRRSPDPFHPPRGDLTRMPPLHPNGIAMCRITPEDWLRVNAGNYRRSETSRRQAENFRRDTSRLIQSKEQLTRRTQTESSRWIGERITDISYWRSELGFELEHLLRDTEALRQVKQRLDKALTETEGPQKMARECLFQRQKRMGSDRVNDVVEKELVQEVIIIKSCQEHLERVRDKVQKQLESNRRAQHQLEKDLNDKHVAYQIDSRCHALSNCSTSVNFYPEISRLDTSVSVPISWARYSEDNIGKSASERAASREIQELVERTLIVTARDMWSQYNGVNVALTNRISQMQHAKNTLQQHLSKTLQEMQQTERTIADLEVSIREKRAPLRVAQSRLEERTRRPNMELCKDPPHTRLLAEVGHIQDTVWSLRQRLSEAQATLQQLADVKAILEQELYTKAHSLYIDQECCQGLRKTYPSTPRLVGYT